MESTPQHEISHVSDTALLVAAARAYETAVPNGLIRDPFAARLAGDRGVALLNGLERRLILCFGVGIRSRFMDDLLMGALAEDRIETVLILGAGLDTRPWRLDLPPALRWIEVDFPDMLDYKARLLTESPKCRLERMPADLNDPAARAALFAAAGRDSLILTEGLLMYLAGETVNALASAAATAGATRWLLEVTSPEFAARIGMNTCQSIENVRDPNCLDGLQIMEVLRHHGWTNLRHRSYAADTFAAAPERVTAMMKARAEAGLPAPPPPPPGDLSGVHLLART